MNDTIITESVKVPFETIRNKWGVARTASGLAMLPKMFPPPDKKFVEEFDKEFFKQIRKEVITMASKCKKVAAKKAAPKKVAAKKPCKKCKK